MKTAEEWDKLTPNTLTSTQKAVELSVKNKLDWIKQIQLDAWKQGMTEAAEIAYNYEFSVSIAINISNEINQKRDDKQTIL